MDAPADQRPAIDREHIAVALPHQIESRVRVALRRDDRSNYALPAGRLADYLSDPGEDLVDHAAFGADCRRATAAVTTSSTPIEVRQIFWCSMQSASTQPAHGTSRRSTTCPAPAGSQRPGLSRAVKIATQGTPT